MLHLFSGATMLGAFFIATDPVSAEHHGEGRLVYGPIRVLVYHPTLWRLPGRLRLRGAAGQPVRAAD